VENIAETASTIDGMSKVEEVSELLRRLCVADNNITVFSITHPIAVKSMQAACEWLSQMTERRNGPVVLSIAEDKLLFEGLPVESRNPQVARFSKRISQLHVNSLHFTPGLTDQEFTDFHAILAMGPEQLDGAGGLNSLLEQRGITHVSTSAASYVLVEEDQRVVSRDSKVMDKAVGKEGDAEVLSYMLGEVLKETRGQDWFVNKVKNSPKQMAALVGEAVQKAIKEAESPESEEETIQVLVQNIKQLGESLTDGTDGTIKEGEEDLKDAVLELEGEIRNRSRHLMTSQASRMFVKEILDVVSAYADQVKAHRISQEFLKDEGSLKKTETLLKDLATKTETSEELLQRLRDEIIKHGLAEEDLEKLLKQATGKKKPRKRKKPFDQALHEGVLQRVRRLGLEGPEHQEMVDRLTTFFYNKLKERDRTARDESRRLTESVTRRDHIIDEIADCGIVIWDSSGKVEHINKKAEEIVSLRKGAAIRPVVRSVIRQSEIPLPRLPLVEEGEEPWSLDEKKLLGSISFVISDDEGNPAAVLLTTV